MTYIAQDQQRLDSVVYNHYKTLKVFETVLQINPHLLEKRHLEAGDKALLPALALPPKENESGALW